MSAFRCALASSPDPRRALDAAIEQIGHGPGDAAATLGWCYLHAAYAPAAPALLQALQRRWPAVQWVGCSGAGVAARGRELHDEPGLALMLADIPAGRFEVFSGARPLQRIEPRTALVHADGATPDLQELVEELSDRTTSGYLFGGLTVGPAAGRGADGSDGGVQIADGVWQGGLSGVAFGGDVPLVSRVTQGCQPIGAAHRVTAAEGAVVLELDGEPALAVLLRELGLAAGDDPRRVLPQLRGTLVGLQGADAPPAPIRGAFDSETRVRHLVGLDVGRRAIAIADRAEPGARLAFCRRDVDAARRDLVRICSEIRDELAGPDPVGDAGRGARPVAGAVYISCAGRGGPHFGGPSAELQVVQRALGDVPLVGFFAGGEIAHRSVHGYTGVLTVFCGSDD